jgi:hypothetical protein
MSTPAPKTPTFARWMLVALLLGVALGGPAAWGYFDHQARWQRPPPKIQMCFIGLGRTLRKPALVAPSEAYPGPAGETLYLTNAQFKAVQCANSLEHGTDKQLALVLANTDPEVQATQLVELVVSKLDKPETEVDAVGLYHLASAILEGVPQSDSIRAERKKLDEALGCRFVSQRLPQCPSRPAMPIWVWILGGIGGFALCLVPASLLQRLLDRFGKKSDAKGDAKSDEA